MANGFGLSAPGNYANLQNARIVDAALDILDHGGTLSDAQLVQTNAALQELTGSWGKDSKWSRNAKSAMDECRKRISRQPVFTDSRSGCGAGEPERSFKGILPADI